jgi:NADH pyrophosphatase NudC (nudix superfamily)
LKQAIMIILQKDKRFLLGKRSLTKVKAPGYWCPISGHIENKETEEEAVIREASEELAIKVSPLKRIASTLTHDQTTILHWWLTEIVSGEPRINNEENTEVRWFSRDELLNLQPVFEEDIEILLRANL